MNNARLYRIFPYNRTVQWVATAPSNYYFVSSAFAPVNPRLTPPTASNSRTSTASNTATLSSSNTGTPSASPSVSFGTSPSVTPSAVSVYPQRISVESLAFNPQNCLSFTELLAFDTNGKLVSSPVYNPPAFASLSANLDPSVFPRFGNDMCVGMSSSLGISQGCSLLTGLCGTNVSQSWSVDMGYPRRIGSLYLVNNGLAPAQGSINLYKSDGSIITGFPISTGAIVQGVESVNPITLPPPAFTIDTATEVQKQTLVAAVRINSAPTTYLNFR